MPDSVLSQMMRSQARGGQMRLRTLANLRWVAIGGQTLAVLTAASVFGLDLPLGLCALVIAASILFNVVAMQVFPATTRLSVRAATLSMLFDLGQVSALLMLTGGLTNPFSALVLAPVVISASALPLGATVIVGVAALAAISTMAAAHLPLVFASGAALSLPPIYLFGVWAALTVAVLFMAIYARRVAVESYRMSRALAAAQDALAREQRLTAIGAMAAAAAHELGTPLATIKLVSTELADELRDNAELREDAGLIREQAERCRDILADLSRGGRSDAQIRHAPIGAVLAEAAAPHRARGREIVMRLNGGVIDESAPGQPVIFRQSEIVHGLRNLIQNAVDFSQSAVWIDIAEAGETLRVTIGDDGDGFPEELLERLGDPYVTARGGARRARSGGAGYRGMGLGLFIAKTLLERTGARLSFANGSERPRRRAAALGPPATRRPTGAVVAVVWPQDAVVAPVERSRGALGDNPRFTLSNI